MAIELDHLFFCADPQAAEELIRFGLTEGEPNQHPGQGTSNRRFFFQNAFLEVLWVTDVDEAQSELVRRTGLWERYSERKTDASPFGVGLRYIEGDELPFKSWDYHPSYLPAPLAIQMSVHSFEPTGPLLFAIGFGLRADESPPERRQPLNHQAGFHEITHVQITAPYLPVEQIAEWSVVRCACPAIDVVLGENHCMEIGFDHELQCQSIDFRPRLPVIFRW